MHKEYFVRIVILNYRSAHATIGLVKSLLYQNYKNYEIVVVDNFSGSDDVKILRANLPSEVNLVVSKENGGYSKGNNLGMRLKTNKLCDYFMILNSDVEIRDSDFLGKLLNTFDNHEFSNVYAVSPLVNTSHSTVSVGYQYQVRKILAPYKMVLVHLGLINFLTRSFLSEYLYFNEMPFDKKIMKCDSINGAAFLVKKEVIEEIGFLDECTFLYMEELILGFQIKKLNGFCALNGNCIVDHVQGLSTGSSVKSYNFRMEKYKLDSLMYFLKEYVELNVVVRSLFYCVKLFEMLVKFILRS